jgi:two-component system, sensor histidine kinase PdtaS
VYITSARYLLESGHYPEARAILTKEEKFLTKNSSLIHLASNQMSWARLDSATGDFRSAYARLIKYAQMRDSVLNQEKTNAIAKLNVEYETNKKDQDLLLKEKDIQLLKQKSQLQQGELARSNQTRNGAIAAGILLLVIVVLLIKIAGVSQRANKKLKEQQKEIEKKNVTLEHLVEEKEWLVKEIHHRVKNNFHMVIALLGTQSEYLRTQEAIDAITDSQNRVQAMSLVHQKLYQSENLSDINMAEYIHDLVHHLRTCLNIGTGVQFTFDLDPIRLDLTYCIPLGLIINEAMTNSVKYAFPKKMAGQIGVSFKRVEQDYLELRITDNGVGLPEGYDTRNTGSMGFKLIKGLSDDVDARLGIVGSPGTQIIVHFQYDFPAAARSGARNTQLTNAI